MSAGLPAGVSALLFGAARARRRLERALAERLERDGFAEVLLPILDYFDPYRALAAGAERELYRFVDRDGELLTLRGDFTPMLARLLAPRVGSLELPARLYYRGDVVRNRDAGPGGAREQCVVGVELLDAQAAGVDGPASRAHDEELLALLIELLGLAIGFDPARPVEGERAAGGVALVLGWSGVLDELLAGEDEALAEALARRDRAAVRGRPALHEIVEDGLPDDPSALGSRGAAAVGALIELRDRFAARYPGVSLRIDLAELAPGRPGRRVYYDGLVFQAFHPRVAQPVASGGRYDALFRELGAALGAAGFQIALDVLLGIVPPDGAPAGARGAG
ncbi:MAG TPA: ATP phosphoribosyltransferase regulatory subunit [Thermoanaerobaculia bacterium]|nr:ATP phosphoribosyltransferase regulatory subunit [Thermoanaerobaculia bacterium]